MEINRAVVLITSAGSLLGGTLAAHFAALGARVVLCDQATPQLQVNFNHCRSISDNVYQYTIRDHSVAAIHQVFEFIDRELHHSPDVLINTVTADAMPRILDNRSADKFSQNLSGMTNALFSFGRATAERMRLEKKQGVIVNVVSYADLSNTTGFDNAASIVGGLTQSWAKDLSPFNIRVGGVVPACELEELRWSEVQDELIRNTEYIVSNDYFSGRVMAA